MKKCILCSLLCLSFLVCTIYTRLNVNASDTTINYDKESLEDGVICKEKIVFSNQKNKLNIKKRACIGNYLFVVGGYNDGARPFEPYNYDTFPYLCCYLNDTLKWTYTSKENGFGIFRDIICEEDGIVVVGDVEDNTNISQLIVCKYDYNGNLLYHIKKGGNKNTISNALFRQGSSFIITGWTMATDLVSPNIKSNGMAFVMKTSDKLDYVNIDFFGNDGLNNLYQSVFLNDMVYLYMKISGNGFFKNLNDGYALVAVNEYLELEDYIVIDTIGDVKIRSTTDNILVCDYKYLSSLLVIYEYSSNLNKINTYSLFMDGIDYILYDYDVDVCKNDNKENILIMDITSKGSEKYLQTIIYDSEFNVVFKQKEEIASNNLYDECHLFNGYIYLFGVDTKVSPNVMFGDRFINIIIKNDECYFNGLKADKTYENLDEKTFGYYSGKVYAQLGNVKVSYNDMIYVKEDISVKNMEVYDLNYVLTFNGEGYLNNEKIESNYILDEEGLYLLEVRGKDKNIYITFEVEKLCTDLDIMNNCNETSIDEIIANDTPSLNVIMKIDYTNAGFTKNIETNSYDNYLIILMIGVIGFMFGLVLFKNIGRKKHE